MFFRSAPPAVTLVRTLAAPLIRTKPPSGYGMTVADMVAPQEKPETGVENYIEREY